MLGVKAQRSWAAKKKASLNPVTKQDLTSITQKASEFIHKVKSNATPDFTYNIRTSAKPYTTAIFVDPLAPLKKGIFITDFKETPCDSLSPDEDSNFTTRNCAEITYSNQVKSILDFRDGQLRARTDYSPFGDNNLLVFSPQGKVKLRHLQQPHQNKIIVEKYLPKPGTRFFSSYTNTKDQSGFEISFVEEGISYTFFQPGGNTLAYWLKNDTKQAFLFIPHDADTPADKGIWQHKKGQAIVSLSRGTMQLHLMEAKPKTYCEIYPDSCTLTIVE